MEGGVLNHSKCCVLSSHSAYVDPAVRDAAGSTIPAQVFDDIQDFLRSHQWCPGYLDLSQMWGGEGAADFLRGILSGSH